MARMEICMLILHYWGLMFIQLFTIFWTTCVHMAAVDITIIGHIKNWKRLHYPKWLGGAINKQRQYGYEFVADQDTHPQVILFLLISLFVLGGIIVLIVVIWQVINDIDTWVLWVIDAALYFPAIIGVLILKSFTKRLYFQNHTA